MILRREKKKKQIIYIFNKAIKIYFEYIEKYSGGEFIKLLHTTESVLSL